MVVYEKIKGYHCKYIYIIASIWNDNSLPFYINDHIDFNIYLRKTKYLNLR